MNSPANFHTLIEMLKSYKRILVVGASGSGKSYLSKKIAGQLDLPLYHLDKIFWKPGWKASSVEEFDQNLASILTSETFIMEGTYISNFMHRAKYADAVLFVEIGFFRRLWRILSRSFSTAGMVRDDMADGCVETISWSYFKFLKWALKFEETKKRLLAESSQANIPVIFYQNR